MVTYRKNVFSCHVNFLNGKKCVFCGSFSHICKKTHKGSVYYTDTFRGYNSLKRLGKHNTEALVDKKTKNHINGIEGFWSYAKPILDNYRGVSKYLFQ